MSSVKVRLEICGSSYVVSTNDAEEYIKGLAERLDADMNKMLQESPNASVTTAAVMTALAYLDEADKNNFAADNMRMQIQGYLEDAAKARLSAEEAKREVRRLEKELEFYKTSSGKKREDSLLDYGQEEAERPGRQLGLDEL